jgi:hypothetical protein
MSPLIAALLDPAAYPSLPPAPAPRLIETHISWVILAGDFAYKLKKPLNLGFLDFSTLALREHFCREELRLNRRLAPEIYLNVVAVAGTPPRFGGDGPVLEWAVQMRAFPADATLDREPAISPEQIDAIADRIAVFHGEIAASPSGYGDADSNAESVRAPVAENFRQLRELLPAVAASLDDLERWSIDAGKRLTDHYTARKRQGFVRECHGDLHLGNIAWVDDAPLIFDALEFNPGLRQIDVISEIAFLHMDLVHRGLEPIAWRLLNRYLEHTGDYAGLAALPYYLAYRALVRAKVAAIRASQAAGDFAECLGYLALARRLIQRPAAALLLMHGVSGSGKTWWSQILLEQLPGIRLRSDVERKRLFGLPALADSRQQGADIYTREAGERTRARLLELAGLLLDAGFRVIVDATFIHLTWRRPFQELAENRALPWLLAAPEAAPELLRRRVIARQSGGRDASEAGVEVLDAQLAAIDPYTPDEQPHVVRLSGESGQALHLIRDALP